MDVNAHQYYVLISGRWYTSPSLRNHWKYVASGDLPADFAKIPEGSPKDNVLASVAGTAAAREAVMDAQVPQTAKVDRSTATTSVVYNGNPRFQSIQGTKMKYAVNTSSSVLLNNGIYYTVDNGVWFQSQDGPNGPWIVCTERPEDVDRIPASNPLYNVKYVYVYDVTPGYVYMGYTPGYLNTFIYGPTVVYGTGFYYDPWFNGFYYARPWTWGFNMCYNPWAGWSIGYGYSFGWFNFGISFGRPGYWNGGWWGPRIYRPPYAWNHHRSSGYYGRNYSRSRNVRVVNNYNTTNIYVNRTGVVTHNNRININNNRNNRIGSFNNTNNRPGGARPEFNNNNNNNSNRLGPANGASARPGFNQNRTPQVQNQPEATRPATRPAPLTPVAPQTQRVPNTAPNNNGRFSDRDVFQRNQNNTNNSQQPQRQPNTMRPAPTPNNNNNNPAPPARNFSIERGERKH